MIPKRALEHVRKTGVANKVEIYDQPWGYPESHYMFADAFYSLELYPELIPCQHMGTVSREHHKNR